MEAINKHTNKASKPSSQRKHDSASFNHKLIRVNVLFGLSVVDRLRLSGVINKRSGGEHLG